MARVFPTYRTVPYIHYSIKYNHRTIPYRYGTVPYRYRTVRYRTGTVSSQISFALLGSLRVLNRCFIDSERYFAYGTSYDRGTNHASVHFLLLISCCVRVRASVSVSTQVIFVLNSEIFRHRSVIIRLFSIKTHIRHPYEIVYSFFQLIQINR